jgi:hypothetical protein
LNKLPIKAPAPPPNNVLPRTLVKGLDDFAGVVGLDTAGLTDPGDVIGLTGALVGEVIGATGALVTVDTGALGVVVIGAIGCLTTGATGCLIVDVIGATGAFADPDVIGLTGAFPVTEVSGAFPLLYPLEMPLTGGTLFLIASAVVEVLRLG